MFAVSRLVYVFMTASFLLSSTSAKSKYTDETRPYEFGFNIEGNQHRHESKDENGIIMGEFGFITADGVYHVTVYATDENGNFKILSMKNIKLGATPEKPPPNATPITEFTTTTPLPPVTQPPFTTPKASKVVSCSHCSIPEPPKPPAPAVPAYQQPQQNLQAPFSPQQNQPQSPFQQQNQYPQQNQNQQPGSSQYPGQPGSSQYPGQPGSSQYPQQPGSSQYPQNNQQQPGSPAPGPFDTPVLVSGHLQTVDASALNTPLRPNEQPGLPNGITEETMSELLYRFNYTIGFHGHREEGYANGAKVGEYFINFRNGLATRVSYVANEHGYFPKIQTVRISALETPHPDTEKNPEFGLKGYEFKWFHAPRHNNVQRK